MDRPTALGLSCTILALIGYGVGILEAYPGRSLTVAGVLVGGTLLAVGGGQ